MQAAQFHSYGPPEVLHIAEVPEPTLHADSVLVRVRASSVNPYDLIVRSGKLRLFTGFQFPLGTGLDFAGDVSAVGSQVKEFQVGDRVWGTIPVSGKHKTGAAAEYVATPAARVAQIPKGLNYVEAASLAVVGTTALTALTTKVDLQRGERVLVRGAAGGVGACAVQLAHAMGSHVTALASAKDVDFVKSLGADEVLDYKGVRPKRLPHFDVVLDTAGSALESFRRRLTPRGRMVTVNFGSASALFTIGLSTIFGSRRIRSFSANPTRKELDAITSYIEAGALRPGLGKIFPLNDIVAAHTSMGTKGGRGKRVLAV